MTNEPTKAIRNSPIDNLKTQTQGMRYPYVITKLETKRSLTTVSETGCYPTFGIRDSMFLR